MSFRPKRVIRAMVSSVGPYEFSMRESGAALDRLRGQRLAAEEARLRRAPLRLPR
jgi:hypothetical protein